MARSYTKKKRSIKKGGVGSIYLLSGQTGISLVPIKKSRSLRSKTHVKSPSLSDIGFKQSPSEIARIKNDLTEVFETTFDKTLIKQNTVAFDQMFSKYFSGTPKKKDDLERAIYNFVRSTTVQIYTYYQNGKSGGSKELTRRRKSVSSTLLISAFSIAIGLFSLFVVYLMWMKVANKTGLAEIGDEAEAAVNAEFQEFADMGGKSFFMFLYNSVFNRALYSKFFTNIQKKAFAKLVEKIGEEGQRVSDVCYTGNTIADAFFSVFSAESLSGCMGAVIKHDIETLTTQITFQVKLLEYDFLGMYRLINVAVIALPAGFAGIVAVARPAIQDNRDEYLAIGNGEM